MSAVADDESQQNFILAFVLGLIALVIMFVIGIVLYSHNHKMPPQATAMAAAPATTVAVVTETVSVVIPDGASIRIVGDTVNFYFATASADLAPRAAEALAVVIKGVEGGRRAVVSGFHDTTGEPALNEQLAQKRAETVRDVLTGLGVPAAKIELRKPPVTTGSGSDAQARRVEVRLVD
ncbi:MULTISPECIES: OmpA family protein [unclassified Variovorax]|uniref:OmpA family protein n=1 Tax=unclassified Variovorax TaxID=663243 RepID=UPI00076D8467|nr:MULTISPECIES: OmpA family protein [unclassified Variovorax]KWT93185.1 Cytochrome c oxidase polypeptide II [Variovorax sp. WDL1]PNG47404.1 Outer membrane protein A [Variovorax sp. B2]PNG47945.1 Outer membrane protein A [Variovorax sp. B4]VTV15314.1 Outer membrane protein II [Variovorax sp. WDL1]